MTQSPDFSDLTPPPELLQEAFEESGISPGESYALVYRAGAQHGWQQARQLWPEPIADRPPSLEDADHAGRVQFRGIYGRWDHCF